MKYSKWIGLLAAAAIIFSCYQVWIKIPSAAMEIGGMWASGKQNFGKPGLVNLVFTVIAAILFLVPAVWAKRTNIFIAGLNIAWSIRNMMLLGRCYAGDCPEKQFAFYLLMIASVVMLLMTFVPDIPVKDSSAPGGATNS